jgi:hypothetical protein
MTFDEIRRHSPPVRWRPCVEVRRHSPPIRPRPWTEVHVYHRSVATRRPAAAYPLTVPRPARRAR